MKKLFTILALVFFLGQGEAFAQFGYGGFYPFGGNEAARVVAGNQAMIWSLGQQWPGGPFQYPSYPSAQQIFVGSSQGQVVCMPKPRGHQWKDVLGGAGLGAGIGLWTAGKRGAIGGAMAGAGGGALVTNHEYDCWLVQQTGQPVAVQQPTQTQYPSVTTEPSVQGPPIVIESAPRLAGVPFKIRNESRSTIAVEIPDGRRAVLAPGATARVMTPDIRVFIVQPDGRGSFDEFEIELETTQDSTLPGWRIPAKVRLKSP
jgi:hypothetical protein